MSTPTVARGGRLGDSKTSKPVVSVFVHLLPLNSLLLKYKHTCLEKRKGWKLVLRLLPGIATCTMSSPMWLYIHMNNDMYSAPQSKKEEKREERKNAQEPKRHSLILEEQPQRLRKINIHNYM